MRGPLASRRALFCGSVAMVLPANAAITDPSADATLLRLCAEFLDLERQGSKSFDAIEDDDERLELLTPIYARQNDLSREIEDIRPTTLAGFTAIAQAAAGWAPDLIEEGQDETHLILLRGLLVSLIGGAA